MIIGFIGAPGSGKTTSAFGLCYHLKKLGHNVEFVPEFARRQIMDCRTRNVAGIGGMDGQKHIYKMDRDGHEFYRRHANALTITDGTTINCFFYGLDELDLIQEAARYDLLFYIPLTEMPPTGADANRMQDAAQSLAMGQRWQRIIAPLMKQVPNIVLLEGYPTYSQPQMIEVALRHVQERLGVLAQAA